MSLRNITTIQWFGIIILFNTTLLGGSSQLGDLLLSATVVKAILALATLGNGFLGGLVTMFGGAQTQINNALDLPQAQNAMVRAVAKMPGVSRIAVNDQATPELAQAAVDTSQPKIGPVTPEIRSTLQNIAKGA
jgi:hypothetical protein